MFSLNESIKAEIKKIDEIFIKPLIRDCAASFEIRWAAYDVSLNKYFYAKMKTRGKYKTCNHFIKNGFNILYENSIWKFGFRKLPLKFIKLFFILIISININWTTKINMGLKFATLESAKK